MRDVGYGMRDVVRNRIFAQRYPYLKADGGVAPMNPNNPERKNINPDGSRPSEVGIDCFSCSHFYITYDPPFPYGCRAVGFKSRRMPSQEMLASSGIDCQYFVEKEKRR